jgi:hypothetical protein
MECYNCDEEIYYGVCVSFLTHNGLPVIGFDTAAQTRFDCPHCDASNYTGELEVFVEGGESQDVDYEIEEETDDDEDPTPDDGDGNRAPHHDPSTGSV